MGSGGECFVKILGYVGDIGSKVVGMEDEFETGVVNLAAAVAEFGRGEEGCGVGWAEGVEFGDS